MDAKYGVQFYCLVQGGIEFAFATREEAEAVREEFHKARSDLLRMDDLRPSLIEIFTADGRSISLDVSSYTLCAVIDCEEVVKFQQRQGEQREAWALGAKGAPRAGFGSA